MKRITILISMLLLIAATTFAQVGINLDGSAPDVNSILHVKGNVSTRNIFLQPGENGGVGIGIDNPSHMLTIQSGSNNYALRLIGTGDYGSSAILNFGDYDYVRLEEDEDDKLTIYAYGRTAIMGGKVGIGTKNPDNNLSVNGNVDFTGNVGVGTKVTDASAVLEIVSTDKGLLMPRLNLAQIEAIASPANGLILFNTDDNRYYFYDASIERWIEIAIGGRNIEPGGWTCGSLFTDIRDNQSYTTLQIGAQCWMSENLNVGTMVNYTQDQIYNPIIEKYCFDNDLNNCDTHGGLYQWGEMMQYVNTPGVQGICPAGWHLPTDDEYKILEMEVGMSYSDANSLGMRGTNEGSKLASNASLWYEDALTLDPEFGMSGFDASPGGTRFTAGLIDDFGSLAYFWTSSENGSEGMGRSISNLSIQVYRGYVETATGRSVRCLKD